MRAALLVFAIACGSSTPPAPPSTTSTPTPAAPSADAAPAAPEIAPRPYTADQIRDASPAGRVIAFRIEVAGQPTAIQVIRFVTSDAQGADLETSTRDEKGAAIGDPKRSHATWDELVTHATFPLAATTIERGFADTPAGKLPSKVYIVKSGDEVSHFYFAIDQPGPPVLFYTEKAGTRVMTSTLLAEPPADPIACKTDDDCWIDGGGKPIARPKSERGKKLRPCKDSERVPACKQSVCTVAGYKC